MPKTMTIESFSIDIAPYSQRYHYLSTLEGLPTDQLSQ